MHIIIHEQNRDTMKQELEVHDSFVTTHKNMDTIDPPSQLILSPITSVMINI